MRQQATAVSDNNTPLLLNHRRLCSAYVLEADVRSPTDGMHCAGGSGEEGVLSEEEFVSLCVQHGRLTPRVARACFLAFDLDNSNYINRKCLVGQRRRR